MARVKPIVIDLVALWLVDRRKNLSAAVKALHASHLYPVYEARRKPCAEAVIDVDHGDSGSAGVEHAQERG